MTQSSPTRFLRCFFVPALFVVLAFFVVSSATAQDRGLAVTARQFLGDVNFDVGKQYAVIIGIDKYREWNGLRSAVSEAREVRRVLSERYYIDEFFELYDEAATAANIRSLFMKTLPAKIGIRDSLLVFYAGHGYLDTSQTGFWIACDGTRDELDQSGWLSNAQLRNLIGNLKSQRTLVLADACFAGDFLNVHRGASPIVDNEYFRKALRLTARQALTSGASETVPDQSEFGRQLVSLLERNSDPYLDAITMYDRIRLGVTKTQPLLGTLPGNETGASFVLFLKPSANTAASGTAAAVAATASAAPAAKPRFGMVIAATGNVAVTVAAAARVTVLGDSIDIPAGTLPVNELPPDDVEVSVAYADGKTERRTVRVNAGETTALAFSYVPAKPAPAIPANFVAIPGGTFIMGDTAGGVDDNEKPLHEVTVSAFHLAKYETTLDEFRVFINASGYRTSADVSGNSSIMENNNWVSKPSANWINPGFKQSGNEPVICVSWYDAIAYCNWRSILENRKPAYSYEGEGADYRTWPSGWNTEIHDKINVDWLASGYRLPTEAEWEYAAKGGARNQTALYAGGINLDELGWFYSNSRGKTEAVGQKKANDFGVYDLSGNVWEWCWDWYGTYGSSAETDPRGPASGKDRMERGGSWNFAASLARVSRRMTMAPECSTSCDGFRLLLPAGN